MVFGDVSQAVANDTSFAFFHNLKNDFVIFYFFVLVFFWTEMCWYDT